MRMLIASFFAAITILFSGSSQATDNAKFLTVFHAKLAELIRTDRNIAVRHISDSIETCISLGAKYYWRKETVRRAGVDAYVETYSLMTLDSSKEQRTKKFQRWTTQEYYRLPDVDRGDFAALMRSDFYGAQTAFCISTELRKRL